MTGRYPNIWHLRDLFKSANENMTELPDGRWIPARPLGLMTLPARIRATWLVFTGRADAVLWPGGQ